MKNRYIHLVATLAVFSVTSIVAENQTLVTFHPGQVVTAKAMNQNFQILQKATASSQDYSLTVPSSADHSVLLDSYIKAAEVRAHQLCTSAQPCYVVVKLQPGRYQYHGQLPQNIILQGVPGSVLALTGDLGLSAQSQLYDLTITSDHSVRLTVEGQQVELHNVLLAQNVQLDQAKQQPFLSAVRQANKDRTVSLLKTVN